MFKKFALQIIVNLAKKVIKVKKPKIIGITGSYGKTSTKVAIATVLSQHFKTSFVKKNFNNEFGMPLSILGMHESPAYNPWLWLKLIVKGIYLATPLSQRIDVMVIEYGIDKPGDMDFLLSIAKPDMVVITAISYSHYANFEDENGIWQEKIKLAEAVSSDGFVLIHNKIKVSEKINAKVYKFHLGDIDGESTYAIGIDDEKLDLKPETKFSIFKYGDVFYQGNINLIAESNVISASIATIIAKELGLVNGEIQSGLAEMKQLQSRMSFIAGKKGSLVIDDTYNASFESVVLGLQVLKRVKRKKKIAFLGDMLELGTKSQELHEALVEYILNASLDAVYLVGPFMSSLKNLLEGNVVVHAYTNVNELKKSIGLLMDEETVFYVKGSQGIRMEKMVLPLMAEPAVAKELVCRQDPSWLIDEQ